MVKNWCLAATALLATIALCVGCTDISANGLRAAAAGDPTRIVAILGQSNATGKGNVANVTLETGLDVPLDDHFLVQRLATSNAPPITWVDYPVDLLAPRSNGTFGVELTLGRDLGPDIVIAKMAVPGSGLYGRWKPTATTDTPPLYEQARDWLQTQQTELDAELVGIVWIQGNSDSNTLTASSVYAENLEAFVSALRSDFGPDLSFVYDRLPFTAAYSDRVRTEQAEFLAAHADDRVVQIDTDDLDHLDDDHYTADALVTLGHRFADALHEWCGT